MHVENRCTCMYMYVHTVWRWVGWWVIRRASRRQSCRTDHSVLVWPSKPSISGEHVIPITIHRARVIWANRSGYLHVFFFIFLILNTC